MSQSGSVERRWRPPTGGTDGCKHTWPKTDGKQDRQACGACGATRLRSDGWTAWWFAADPTTGNRTQHSKGGFRRQADARRYLTSILQPVEDGVWRKEKPLTVRDLLNDHWLPAVVSKGRRAATLDQYELCLRRIVPVLGAVTVQALTPAHAQGLQQGLAARGLAPRTQQLTVGVLKSATRWAARTGMVARDPLLAFDRPHVESVPMSAWTVTEARQFLASTADDPLAWAWALLLTRGLRRGEIAGLRWADLDDEHDVLRITRTRIVVAGRATDSTPKTKAGRRAVPLDAALLALLRRHKAAQSVDKLAAGEAYGTEGWLFADALGRPYFPATLGVWFGQRAKAAGLRRIRLHDTRHTAASLMLAGGVPTRVVTELLGHSDPTITLSVYAHVLPGMAEAAGAALSAALLG